MAPTRARKLAPIFLVTAFAAGVLASPASAQKPGGSITVGQELDISGFDPLKVGVFDTSANTAAAAIFDTLEVSAASIQISRANLGVCSGRRSGVEQQGARAANQ